MSGIAVIYDSSSGDEGITALIPQMCQALRRSEREATVEWYSRPGFAMGRCKPILINQIPQPAWNEEKTICAFFHGEIFGYEDLKRALERKGHQFSGDSHAEFVVHLYEDRGDAFMQVLNGGFVLALWDSRQQRLLIANDRYGLRPLYTTRSGDRYLWASAPQAILADASFPRQVNLAAMADHLCLSTPQGSDTMFVGIDELLPASLVICQEGQVHCQQYWDFAFQEEETGIAADDYLDELISLLRQTAERQQADELSVGLLLSGGFDSRLVLSVLNKHAIKAFTFGTPFCDDVRFARRVAETVHVPHFALEIKPDYLKSFARIGLERTGDLFNCDRFCSISVYDEIASQVNALIMGHVGEYIFMTAKSVLRYISRNPGKDLDSEYRAGRFSLDFFYGLQNIMTEEELEQLVQPAYFQVLKGLARSRFHEDLVRCPSRHVVHKYNYWCIKHRQGRLYNRLAGSLLPDNLEHRPFFFDNDLVDLAQSIPPSLRWGESPLYRRVILRVAPEIARIPATSTGDLPLYATDEQVARHKSRMGSWRRWRYRVNRIAMGLISPMRETGLYADYDQWLKQELRDWAESILLDPRTLKRGYWKPSGITRLLENHRTAERGTQRLARQLTALISFELWHRMYLD